jgi:putative hydrolase of the HAD superfamily
MQKILLFDTDGVLVHSEMWSVAYARKVWLAPDTMKSFFSGLFQECIIGKADLREVLAPYLQDWKWGGSVDDYLESWFSFENQPDHTLLEEIQKLRNDGYMCYVATNQEKYRLQYLRDIMEFNTLFDGVFCSAEIGYKKPEIEYYEYITQAVNMHPNKIVYFDDDEKNITSAQNLGIASHLYKPDSHISFYL